MLGKANRQLGRFSNAQIFPILFFTITPRPIHYNSHLNIRAMYSGGTLSGGGVADGSRGWIGLPAAYDMGCNMPPTTRNPIVRIPTIRARKFPDVAWIKPREKFGQEFPSTCSRWRFPYRLFRCSFYSGTSRNHRPFGRPNPPTTFQS